MALFQRVADTLTKNLNVNVVERNFDISLFTENLSLIATEIKDTLENIPFLTDLITSLIVLKLEMRMALNGLVYQIIRRISLDIQNVEKRIRTYLNWTKACESLSLVDDAGQAAKIVIQELIAYMQDANYDYLLLNECFSSLKKFPNQVREIEQLVENQTNSFAINLRGKIIGYYNEMKMAEEATKSFNKYLKDILLIDRNPVIVIETLLSTEFFSSLLPQQKRALLEAAESLLPRVPSISKSNTISRIAEGYLEVDGQKSLELIKNYENQQRKRHLGIAEITFVAMGVLVCLI